MDYTFDFAFIADNWRYLVSGLWIAVPLTAVSLLLSIPGALVVALTRLSGIRALEILSITFVGVFRNTPTLVQLIWAYYCLPILTGVRIDAFSACVISLSLSASAYLGEVARAGIRSIDVGQREAAKTIGLTPFAAYRHVILPQALKRMVPPCVNEIVTLFKFSSLASVLGVADLTYQAQVLSSIAFRPIEIFTFLGLEYLVICSVISLFAALIERRFSGAKAA